MKRIASVKYGASGQMEFFTSEDPFFGVGDLVLVDSGQGVYVGRVMAFYEHAPDEVDAETLAAIVRVATPEDRAADVENCEMLFRAKRFCDQRIRERQLDMKLVDVETLYDRSKLIFFFTAPTRIDFRELVKDLVREYHTRIELRQIGVRHETQMLGALGGCGMTCCCRRFLRKFMPVTIKMAKEQNLFLNPTKISGICGRLLCCLSYEQENYDIFHRSCPRLGKRYQTARGPLKVLRANMFRNSIAVLSEQGEELELTLDEWKDLDPKRPDGGGVSPQGTPYGDHNADSREPSRERNGRGHSGQGRQAGHFAETPEAVDGTKSPDLTAASKQAEVLEAGSQDADDKQGFDSSGHGAHRNKRKQR